MLEHATRRTTAAPTPYARRGGLLLLLALFVDFRLPFWWLSQPPIGFAFNGSAVDGWFAAARLATGTDAALDLIYRLALGIGGEGAAAFWFRSLLALGLLAADVANLSLVYAIGQLIRSRRVALCGAMLYALLFGPLYAWLAGATTLIVTLLLGALWLVVRALPWGKRRRAVWLVALIAGAVALVWPGEPVVWLGALSAMVALALPNRRGAYLGAALGLAAVMGSLAAAPFVAAWEWAPSLFSLLARALVLALCLQCAALLAPGRAASSGRWARPRPGPLGLGALLALFVTFRLAFLLTTRVAWSDYNFYQQYAELAPQGLLPFVNYWLEYPPLFPWLAVSARWLASLLHTSLVPDPAFHVTLGLALLAAECGNLTLVYLIGREVGGEAHARRAAVFYALLFAPLYTWAFYFDALPLCLLLLSLWLILRGRFFLAGLASGLGFMTKLFAAALLPLALRAAWTWRQRTLALAGGALAVVTVAAPFLLGDRRYLVAGLLNPFYRGSWETVWALLEGNCGVGFSPPPSYRLDPASAFLTSGNAALPWPLITLGFAALYLVLLSRRFDTANRRVVTALAALILTVFLIYSKGYSPQWLAYLLAFVAVLLPNWRGLFYVAALTGLNLLEWPTAFWMFPDRPELPAALAIARTALLVALCLEHLMLVFPRWGERARAWRKPLYGAGAAALAVLALAGIWQLAPSFVAQRYPGARFTTVVETLRQEAGPSTMVLLTSQSAYDEFTPLLRGYAATGLALDDARDVNERPVRSALTETDAARLERSVAAHDEVWLVFDGDDAYRSRHDAVEAWLARRAYLADAGWLEPAGYTRFIAPSSGEPAWQPVGDRFGEAIALESYALDVSGAPDGGVARVALRWLALAPPGANYTVFVQALDQAGGKVAQVDTQPLAGHAPTSTWTAGTVVEDRLALRLSRQLPPGPLRVVAGMYDSMSGKRLAVGAGGDMLTLGEVGQ